MFTLGSMKYIKVCIDELASTMYTENVTKWYKVTNLQINTKYFVSYCMKKIFSNSKKHKNAQFL